MLKNTTKLYFNAVAFKSFKICYIFKPNTLNDFYNHLKRLELFEIMTLLIHFLCFRI